MADQQEPLSTYTDRLPQVRRQFSLYADRVEVVATWTLGKTHHNVVKLTDLQQQPKTITIRNRWCKRAITVAMLAAATAIVISRPGYADWMRQAANAVWGVSAAAAVVAVVTFRKSRFARFARHDGKPGLDIGSAGPEARRSDEFTQAVQKQIRKQR